MAEKPEAPANWEQARARIDRGETGDKIAGGDPAAAPLGTDAEAGGASTPAADIARSIERQGHGGDPRAAARAPLTAGRRRLVPWLVLSWPSRSPAILALLVAG